jgi:hypothetical protein
LRAPARNRWPRTCSPRRWRTTCAQPQAAIDLHIDPAGEPVEERIDLAIGITNELDPNLIARPLGIALGGLRPPAYLAAHGVPAASGPGHPQLRPTLLRQGLR